MSGNPKLDRRSERHQATRQEILEAAWDLARTHGLAGLSLRELASEVGMQPQSLYTYFESKNAIYDALFAQGCRAFIEGQRQWRLTGEAAADLRLIGRYYVEFCAENPERYQLLYQRTIPGFEPSVESFDLAVQSLTAVQEHLNALGFDDPRDIDLFTAVGSGLAAQQLSNDPGGDRWILLIDEAVDMFINHIRSRPRPTSPKGRS